MKKIAILVIALMVPMGGSQANDPHAYQIPRTEVVPIEDTQNGRQYEIYVKLPESYWEDAEKLFPVIYTTDAAWHMDLLSGTTEYLMPDTILVGISWQKNSAEDIDDARPFVSRFRDYSFVAHENPEIQAKYQMGQASTHLTFIRNDVIQYIEQRYRVTPGQRAYLGYSMGASFGSYVLFAKPDTFNQYILGSPSLDQLEIDFLTGMQDQAVPDRQNMNTHVFVSIGEKEEANLELTRAFVSLLQQRNQPGFPRSDLQIIEDSDHSTAVPETFVRGIKWLSALTGE
ncbi:alpha/beta hydrolase [Kordiimonas gwangyangensis]|uniref:alpha/beta hydrolase n=1 Tax=Kordiimonas gwangyangensis TaxID=288022 RepID=UPI00036CF154|nr:alpha/beta hydrolase-fold protein [Kordiimonas gwangyangensis]